MEHPKHFEDIIRAVQQDKDFIFTNDFDENGEIASPSSSINAGVYIARNSPWTKHFLKSVYTDFPNPDGQVSEGGRYDQQGIRKYRKRDPADFSRHVSIVGWRSMNTW